MNSQKLGGCFSPSPSFDEERLSNSERVIEESLAAFRRVMSAMEQQNADREGVWPRNYSCWTRAPEPIEGAVDLDYDGDRGGSHMKTMAKHWEEQFDELMKDRRTGQYRERLEWFLFKLHSAVQTVETQSDGTQLLLFCDGSAYGEEAELDALLALAPRRNSGRKDNQPEFACGRADQRRCRKGQPYVGRVQRRG